MAENERHDDPYLNWVRRMESALRIDAATAHAAGDREQAKLLFGHANDLRDLLGVVDRLRTENEQLRTQVAEGVSAYA